MWAEEMCANAQKGEGHALPFMVMLASRWWSNKTEGFWVLGRLFGTELLCVCPCVSPTLPPHGLWPDILLCPRSSPGRDTRVGSHSLLQGIFSIQGSNPSLLHHRQVLYHLRVSVWMPTELLNCPPWDWNKHPSVLLKWLLLWVWTYVASKSHGRRSLVGCSPWGHRVRHDWVTSLSLFTFMHWRRIWQPNPVFLPGESQGQGSLVGCHLWGHTESDTTEVT